MQQDGVGGEKEGGKEGGKGDVKTHRMSRVMPLVPFFGHHLFFKGDQWVSVLDNKI